MIASVQHRQEILLSGREWQLITEPQSLDDVEHRFSDLTLHLSNLFGKEEDLNTSPQANLQQQKELLGSLEQLKADFHTLVQQMRTFSGLPTDSQTGSGFLNLQSALNFANVEAMILETTITCREVRTRISGTESVYPPQESVIAASITGREAHEKDSVLAEKILAALQYATRGEMGLYGAQKSLFALRMTLCNISRHSPVFQQLANIYRDLSERGLKHSQDINQVWGELGDLPRNK